MSAKARRKTLYVAGRHGDKVRALVDMKRDRVIVHYRDANGIPRKRVFDNTGKGRAEGKAWAETYHSERGKIEAQKAAPKTVTLLDLWNAFADSPAFAQIRPKTKIAYRYRFARWMNFMTSKAIPDDTTLLDVDRYITRGTKTGIALNQLRQVINVARIIYKWGQRRKLVQTNELNLFRWQQPKDAPVVEPAEYTDEEFQKLLGALNPQHGGQWRAHSVLMLAGHQGMRANALTNLSWADINTKEGSIDWPPEFQKNGKAFRQPLTWDAVAALETARYWRERSGYAGRWIFYAGGGNRKLGAVVTGNARHYRKKRTAEQDRPVTYQAIWIALRNAEKRAKVKHLKYRALHGLRKMAAGNVADATGDARLGMEWINDTDPKQMRKYLKTRSARLDRAASAAGTGNRKRPKEISQSVPEVSLNGSGPTRGSRKSRRTNNLARATGRD